MRLLLVEDNTRLNELIEAALRRQGFAVDAVATAGDAEAALNATTHDLIILDLGLPDRDGMDLLASLRSRGIGNWFSC